MQKASTESLELRAALAVPHAPVSSQGVLSAQEDTVVLQQGWSSVCPLHRGACWLHTTALPSGTEQ